MSRYSLASDRLFHRPWRPGHPFRPKCGRVRRIGIPILFLTLCLVIGGYLRLTNSNRMRHEAEAYLSGLIGGRVEVAGATLSIFEGLRLDDVKVFVDDPARGEMRRTDSALFTARAFVISYDTQSMLRGELVATRIIAENPHIHLATDARTGDWNFRRLGEHNEERPAPPLGAPAAPPPLPELLLRNARVEVDEVQGAELKLLGYVAIDGHLTSEDGPDGQKYRFVLQSRGRSEAMGPLVSGSVQMKTGHISARLQRFKFGQDVLSLLLADVRAWCERHELAGDMNIPSLDYTPPRDGKRATFAISASLDNVTLAARPEEWATPAETARRAVVSDACAAVSAAYRLGGFSEPRPAATAARVPEPDEPPPPPRRTPFDCVRATLAAAPIRLRHVGGTFLFTDAGVEIQRIEGRVEGHRLWIDGHVDGYDPDAPVALHVGSPDDEDINLPPEPRFVTSLSGPALDIYEQFRPQGRCRLRVDVARPAPSGPVTVSGRVDVLDGRFVDHDFPYPLRGVAGVIRFGKRPGTNEDWVWLEHLIGRGAVGGPNENAALSIDGTIGPLIPDSPDSGVDVVVHADEVRNEPRLTEAFPPEARAALAVFDAPGKGEFPRFRGSFTCKVHRPPGPGLRMTQDLDIDLSQADAIFAGFTYPMRNAKAVLRVRDGHADVVSATLQRGNTSLKVSGRVGWPAADGQCEPTALNVTVRNLPVDEDLLAALPADSAEWVRRTGVKAKLDVDGKIRSPEPAAVPGASAAGGVDDQLRARSTMTSRYHSITDRSRRGMAVSSSPMSAGCCALLAIAWN